MTESATLLTVDEISYILQNHGYNDARSIGQGHYGTVYRCFSVRYKMTFVCKVMYHRVSFNDELESLITLEHPNIIRLYEYFQERNAYFLILEDCPGGDVANLIKNGTMSETDLYSYIGEMINALDYLHSQGVAHLDIKPANMLISKYGQLKLADFGLAHAQLGACTVFKGTLHFMAPEVLEKKPYDPFKADVWSLGLTIYSLAFGYLPFSCKGEWEFIKQYGLKYDSMPRRISSQFNALLIMCLTANPEDRSSISEVKDFFERCVINKHSEWNKPTLRRTRLNSYGAVMIPKITNTPVSTKPVMQQRQLNWRSGSFVKLVVH